MADDGLPPEDMTRYEQISAEAEVRTMKLRGTERVREWGPDFTESEHEEMASLRRRMNDKQRLLAVRQITLDRERRDVYRGENEAKETRIMVWGVAVILALIFWWAWQEGQAASLPTESPSAIVEHPRETPSQTR